jgi:hypothetical protein
MKNPEARSGQHYRRRFTEKKTEAIYLMFRQRTNFWLSVSYYISIDTGLLSYAEKTDNGKTVYLMAVVEEDFSEPPADMFRVPADQG